MGRHYICSKKYAIYPFSVSKSKHTEIQTLCQGKHTRQLYNKIFVLSSSNFSTAGQFLAPCVMPVQLHIAPRSNAHHGASLSPPASQNGVPLTLLLHGSRESTMPKSTIPGWQSLGHRLLHGLAVHPCHFL